MSKEKYFIFFANMGCHVNIEEFIDKQEATVRLSQLMRLYDEVKVIKGVELEVETEYYLVEEGE